MIYVLLYQLGTRSKVELGDLQMTLEQNPICTIKDCGWMSVLQATLCPLEVSCPQAERHLTQLHFKGGCSGIAVFPFFLHLCMCVCVSFLPVHWVLCAVLRVCWHRKKWRSLCWCHLCRCCHWCRCSQSCCHPSYAQYTRNRRNREAHFSPLKTVSLPDSRGWESPLESY